MGLLFLDVRAPTKVEVAGSSALAGETNRLDKPERLTVWTQRKTRSTFPFRV